MNEGDETSPPTERNTPLAMSSEEFRRVGHKLVDNLAEFLESMPAGKVTNSPTVADVKSLLGDTGVPKLGMDSSELMKTVTQNLIDNSLFNGHPRFWGYITSSAAPIGALGDFLASTINQNCGAWQLSPMATEIELQTIRWIAEFVGYPTDCGGVMVSGGNMANFIGFLAGRHAKANWNIRETGVNGGDKPMCFYCSEATHTWAQKAADLFGLGTNAIRWISCDANQRMNVRELAERIAADRRAGFHPFLVAATAGSVATGSVDPINAIADVCESEELWLHVDGAYGAMAATLPEAESDLKAISRADSVALDPHKWLYSPLEAGCTLVRNPDHLKDAFSFNPTYYKFDSNQEQPPTNFFELGMQNSRGFRALKVWLAFKHVGAGVFVESIREDINLARVMADALKQNPEIELRTCMLSITTFRFIPARLRNSIPENQKYLNDLNEALLERIQNDGRAFLSNAVLNDHFLLRACIVNFRTTFRDVQSLPGIVIHLGRQLDEQMRMQSAPTETVAV